MTTDNWYDRLFVNLSGIFTAGLSQEEARKAFIQEISDMNIAPMQEVTYKPINFPHVSIEESSDAYNNRDPEDLVDALATLLQAIDAYSPPFEGEIEGISDKDKAILRERLESKQTPGYPGF